MRPRNRNRFSTFRRCPRILGRTPSLQTVRYMTCCIPYIFKYQFSEQVLKQDNKAITTNKLQIRNFNIVYSDTAYFKVESTPEARDTQTREFNGRVVGSLSNILGQANLASGSYKVSVLTNSKYAKVVITSDSYLPCVFQSAEYEGFLTQRTSRI